MKRLYLMRHCKAEKSSSGGDFGRKLSEEGRQDAAAQAHRLASLDIHPLLILSSDAIRAVETSEIISRSFTSPPAVKTDHEIYKGSADRYLSVISKKGTGNSLLLTGHNPAIEQLASFFEEGGGGMSAGEIAWFDFDIKEWKILDSLSIPVNRGRIKKT